MNEADIGRIKEGMDASFTVDAFPGEFFKGKVTQIRHNAQQTQNVVTYTVVVSFDNPDKKLPALFDGKRAVGGSNPQGRVLRARCRAAV